MNIVDNLQKIKYELPQNVSLVAVSKTKPNEDIILAYNTGQLDFGENKIQELILKHDALPKDIKWHMIGHLQTNKVKYIAPFIHLIHSVDSIKLIKEINKQAINNTKIINILIQIDITNDKTKFGFSINDFDMIMKDELLSTFNNLKVVGLMGMASFTNNQDIIKSQFNSLKDLFNKHKKKLSLDILSMGMSGDYNIAIECQSNLIRLGSTIFGKRK
ncbi:MAG: YggS family pyridoxal phosphate-dependent enzyme [Bacteroidetes bacterium]|jgi:PLP dependent protein|nr:MAG: alanine racemase [Cryomorphaceae bacterium BACL29 MAG-121220-bin8]MDA0757467.1 YggS family pyridoxal phosphate-dependent enzyme [Bacteroidota bacterium]MDA1019156.1 YggS family pyridoxal phosphate-dependent enzyme [Bacteroidota bacterium]|tara:strand:- start:38801 stop:39451 length:651 start_codon:yes stop_codon:yes gene_type:complete